MRRQQRERRAMRLASIVTRQENAAASHLWRLVGRLRDLVGLRDRAWRRRAARAAAAATAPRRPVAPLRDPVRVLGGVADRLVLTEPAVLERHGGGSMS